MPATASDGSAPVDRKARVLLVEDHPLLTDSLRFCLDAEGYEVEVAPVTSRQQVLEVAGRLLPDIVLLDVDLGEPIGDGAKLVAPLTATGATVVVVSGTTQPSRVAACIEEGAAGFVPKSRPLDELVGAVKDALARRPLLTDDQRSILRAELYDVRRRTAGLERLTPREASVLAGLVEGRSVAMIAERAFVSEGTVRSQIRSILTKLDVNSQLAAVAVARRARWFAE
ncbi:MAG: response regulator [Acidimicrobiales bacterium]